MSIRWKLGIIFLVISLVPLVLFTVIGVDRGRYILKQEIGQSFELVAREKAMAVASTLDRRVEEAVSLAKHPAVVAAVVDANSSYAGKADDFTVQEIERIDRAWIKSKGNMATAQNILGGDVSAFLRDYQNRDPMEYGEMFITDRLGATVAMTAMLTDYYQADEGWWREGFAGGKGTVYIDDRGFDLSVNAVVTGVVVPVRFNGEVAGLLKINFKMAYIPAIISNPYEGGDVRVFMHRTNGTAVIDPSDGLRAIVSEVEAKVMAGGMRSGWTEEVHNTEPTIMGYALVQPKNLIYSRFQPKKSMKGVSGESWGRSNWYVFVERNRARAYGPLTDLMAIFVVGGVAIAFIIIFVAGLTATRVTDPLLKLRKGMEIISAGNLDHKISSDRKDEIGEVLRDIDRMVDRLKDTLASRDELNHEIGLRMKVEEALKERSNELERSKVQAEQANQSKSRFLSSMSHELRTPLNAVIGFSQLMQHNPKEPLTAVQKEYTDDIVSSGEILLGLINGMLDLAKIEADQLHLTMEDVYASDVIDESLMLLQPTAATHGVTVINNTTDHPSVLVYADALRLTQVLLNFMSNAVKYNKPGGTVALDSVETDDGYLHISVTDTGMGIPQELHGDIFKPFERLGIEAKKTIEGTGIGLTVTKQLAEMMGGRIGFESEHHKGSTFWVEVPMASRRGELLWDDKLIVGIQQVDDDHKVLIGLLNELSESSLETDEVEKIIGNLIAYTLYHFQREEAVMEACGYPHLDVHRKVHQHLAAKAGQFAEKWRKDGKTEVIQELLEFLRTWLVDHIMKDDAEIGPFAKGKEAEIKQAVERISHTK